LLLYLLMLFHLFYSFTVKTFNEMKSSKQKVCVWMEWIFSSTKFPLPFHSNSSKTFLSLFTWNRHHYLMRGHQQEFDIPTANWHLPRLACFFAIFSLPEFSWFFFQFFLNLWWEQMQKKQHKEDASALLRFGLIILSFPFFFFFSLHPPAPSPQKYKFQFLNLCLSLKIQIVLQKRLGLESYWSSFTMIIQAMILAELLCLPC